MTKMGKNIVVAALARDCEKTLPANMLRIEALRKLFDWSHVVVVENDSKDQTKQILKKWSEDYDGVKIISQDFGTVTIPEKTPTCPFPRFSFYRMEKMISYRNMYLEYVSKLEHPIDYLLVIDLDAESFSVESIVESIQGAGNGWGAIFANGITKKDIFGITFSKIYYDKYATYEYPLQEKMGFTEEFFDHVKRSVRKNLKKFKYYSVVSGFGGIGIYNYNIIKDLRYRVIRNCENENETMCDHVSLNADIIRLGFKNYISADLYVVFGTHSFGAIISDCVSQKTFNFIYDNFVKVRNFFRFVYERRNTSA